MVFYKAFFNKYKRFASMSANEKIVYSAILNYSLMECMELWDSEGKKMDIDEIDWLVDTTDNDEKMLLDVYGLSYKRLADYCQIPVNTLKGSNGVMARLIKKGVLRGTECDWDVLVTYMDIVKGGWFKLVKDTTLKGKQLIFYSFLCERLKHFNENQRNKRGGDIRYLRNKSIDTWTYKLAEDFGEPISAVYSLIRELTRKGYVIRLPNGKLEICSP